MDEGGFRSDELLADLTHPLGRDDDEAAFERLKASIMRCTMRLNKSDPECRVWSEYLLERCFDDQITEYGTFVAWGYVNKPPEVIKSMGHAFYKFAIAATTRATQYLDVHLPAGNPTGLLSRIQFANPQLHTYFCNGCRADQTRNSLQLISMIVFLCDGLLAITPGESSTARRFFNIAQQLPLELQQVLANYAYNLRKFSNLPKDDKMWQRMLVALAVDSTSPYTASPYATSFRVD